MVSETGAAAAVSKTGGAVAAGQPAQRTSRARARKREQTYKRRAAQRGGAQRAASARTDDDAEGDSDDEDAVVQNRVSMAAEQLHEGAPVPREEAEGVDGEKCARVAAQEREAPQVQVEVLVVALADALGDPRAVVIKPHHAHVAIRAVDRARRPEDAAVVAPAHRHDTPIGHLHRPPQLRAVRRILSRDGERLGDDARVRRRCEQPREHDTEPQDATHRCKDRERGVADEKHEDCGQPRRHAETGERCPQIGPKDVLVAAVYAHGARLFRAGAAVCHAVARFQAAPGRPAPPSWPQSLRRAAELGGDRSLPGLRPAADKAC